MLDAPYPNSETRKAENYFISEDDFKGGVKKGIAAGALLGIIAEVALYTFWLILYRKPKSAEEVRACLDIPVIDDVKTRKANEEEVYKKLALFLKEKQGGADHKLSLIHIWIYRAVGGGRVLLQGNGLLPSER